MIQLTIYFLGAMLRTANGSKLIHSTNDNQAHSINIQIQPNSVLATIFFHMLV